MKTHGTLPSRFMLPPRASFCTHTRSHPICRSYGDVLRDQSRSPKVLLATANTQPESINYPIAAGSGSDRNETMPQRN